MRTQNNACLFLVLIELSWVFFLPVYYIANRGQVAEIPYLCLHGGKAKKRVIEMPQEFVPILN